MSDIYDDFDVNDFIDENIPMEGNLRSLNNYQVVLSFDAGLTKDQMVDHLVGGDEKEIQRCIDYFRQLELQEDEE